MRVEYGVTPDEELQCLGIYFNGQRIVSARLADEEAGYIEFYEWDDKQKVLVLRKAHGAVRILNERGLLRRSPFLWPHCLRYTPGCAPAKD